MKEWVFMKPVTNKKLFQKYVYKYIWIIDTTKFFKAKRKILMVFRYYETIIRFDIKSIRWKINYWWITLSEILKLFYSSKDNIQKGTKQR